MAQQIIDTGAAANDGTGEPLRQAFTAVNSNFTEIYTAGPVGSNIQIVGNTISTLQVNQNLTLHPNGIGIIQANSAVVPSINLVYDLGSPQLRWDSVYAGYLFGNGAYLTGINATGTVSNSFSTIAANGVNLVANTATGVLTLLAGNNVTITGSAAANSVTFGLSAAPSFAGTVSAGNVITAGTVSAAGTVTAGNLVTGNITAGNLSFAGRIIGNLSTTGNVTAGNVIATQAITASSDIVSYGNITGTYLFGNGAFLTGITASNNYSNANVAAYLPTYSGNISANAVQVNTLTAQSTVFVSGSITATGNVQGDRFIGNGALLTGISAANVNAATLTGSVLSGNVLYSSLTVVGNLLYVNVDGNVVTTGQFTGSAAGLTGIPAANVTGTVANAAYATVAGQAVQANTASVATQVTANNQPNITAVGALTAVSVVGNASVGRLNIGQANLYLSSASPPVLTVQADAVQFTSSIDVANTVRATAVSANTTMSAAGNVIGGNLVTSGNAVAQYFVGNGRTLTGIVASEVGVLSNLSVTGNTRTGNLVTGGLISATGNIKTAGNVFGTYFIGNGAALTGITVAAGSQIINGTSNVSVGANGNVTVQVANVSNVAVFTANGLSVAGTVQATGNVQGNAIVSDNYFYANGTPVPIGIVYTANTAPPPVAKVTDQWYDTVNDVLFEYISDGVSEYWVDTSTPAFAGGVVANVAISGSMIPTGNVEFDIGTPTASFANTYTNNVYFNNRVATKNLPLGTVTQTTMSSGLGGSVTNSTNFVDISLASVSITPSTATSRVLILATGTSSFSAASGQNVTADTQLVRSPSVSLQVQTVSATAASGGIGATGTVSYSYVDSPATSGTVTYKLQQRVSTASSTVTSNNIWLIALEIVA